MRIVLCDDNKNELQNFQLIIEQAAARLKIPVDFIHCVSANQLLFEMEELRSTIDIILMDISMPPGMNGIEAAKLLRSHFHYQGEILFMSKSPDYMWDAFEVGAFHYIVKNKTPYNKQREIIENILAKADKTRKGILMLKGIGEYRNIPIRDIYYFEAQDHLLVAHYGHGETFAFYSSFEQLLDRLRIHGILRVHRSFLASIDQIQSFSYKGILLKNGEIIPAGRKYLPELKNAVGIKKRTP